MPDRRPDWREAASWRETVGGDPGEAWEDYLAVRDVAEAVRQRAWDRIEARGPTFGALRLLKAALKGAWRELDEMALSHACARTGRMEAERVMTALTHGERDGMAAVWLTQGATITNIAERLAVPRSTFYKGNGVPDLNGWPQLWGAKEEMKAGKKAAKARMARSAPDRKTERELAAVMPRECGQCGAPQKVDAQVCWCCGETLA